MTESDLNTSDLSNAAKALDELSVEQIQAILDQKISNTRQETKREANEVIAQCNRDLADLDRKIQELQEERAELIEIIDLHRRVIGLPSDVGCLWDNNRIHFLKPSGKANVSAFCRQHQLNYNLFYGWLMKNRPWEFSKAG